MGKLFVTLFAFAPAPKANSQWLLHPDTRIYQQYKSCTLTIFWLRDSLYRDTAPVLPTKFVTENKFVASTKLAPRSRQNAIKFVP
jgi:hypothetical protein